MRRFAPVTCFAVTLIACGGSTTPTGTGGVDAQADAPAGNDSGTVDSGGGGTCSPACPIGRTCCNGQCANVSNDPMNCGGCGIACTGATPFCDGTCKAAPCGVDAAACGAGQSCCGNSCCAAGQICCVNEGPLGNAATCYTPTASQPTCPPGCAPACVSDRNAKTAVEGVDKGAVLEAVSRMPITSWAYKTDAPTTRHIGPMAQDFREALRLGASDRTYDPVDAHGVAFASIQALYEKLKAQEARIEKLEAENRACRARPAASR